MAKSRSLCGRPRRLPRTTAARLAVRQDRHSHRILEDRAFLPRERCDILDGWAVKSLTRQPASNHVAPQVPYRRADDRFRSRDGMHVSLQSPQATSARNLRSRHQGWVGRCWLPKAARARREGSMATQPNPFHGAVSDETIAKWLAQFAPDEHDSIRNLLKHFRYYGPEQVNAGVRKLHAAVVAALAVPENSIYFIPVGYVAKSGAVITYLYKTQNQIPQERFLLASDLAKARPSPDAAFVFLDDYIGTGHQARQVWDGILSLNPDLAETNLIAFGALIGTEAGIEHLSRTTRFRVCVVDRITSADLPFGSNSQIFVSEEGRVRARAIVEKYGSRLHPKAPLGYETTQGLLGFFYSTPNNTLPIFWSTAGGWTPLLPHQESYRDPESLFGPPSGLPREAQIPSPAKPLIESAKLSEYDISPDVAIKILNEFKRTDILLVLAPVIRRLGVSEAAFSHLVRLIRQLRHLVHEREPVSSSLMVVAQDCPRDALGKQVLSAASSITLQSTDEILSIAQMIRGAEGALVATSDGKIEGSVVFRDAGSSSYPLIPARYHKAARASLDSRGLLFFFLGDGRATVFHQGNRILVYRAADSDGRRPALPE